MAQVVLAWVPGKRPSWHVPGDPIALIGPEHQDRGIPRGDNPHYHVDWRYVPEPSYRKALQETTRLSIKIIPAESIARIGPMPLPVLRELPQWPVQSVDTRRWWFDFQEQWTGAKLDCGKCPHQGFDLADIPADARGVRQCPLHGLNWGADGALVKLEPLENAPKDREDFAYEFGHEMADQLEHFWQKAGPALQKLQKIVAAVDQVNIELVKAMDAMDQQQKQKTPTEDSNP